MEIRDYNGMGRWSLQALRARYQKYARQFDVAAPLELRPMEHQENQIRWIYPVMFEIIKGMEVGDRACLEIGVECIEENQWFMFGRIIKGNTARALRRSELTESQRERLRRHIVSMLVKGHIPRHYRDYAKLLRKVGVGDWWPVIEARANRSDPYVARFADYFERYARHDLE